MSARTDISFADRATLALYDELQVPALFRPWAALLAASCDDWEGQTVLDLATGSGIVAAVLTPHVGPQGEIIGADISDAMLDLARRRCAGLETPIRFVRSAADALRLPDASVDAVVCQQGFQFFPDRSAAAAETARVLRPGERVIVTTWKSLPECDYFHAVHLALVDIGKPDLAAKIQVPFDHLPAAELNRHFSAAGFVDVRVERRQRVHTFAGGMEQAIATARSTVVGPDLAAMAAEGRAAFREALAGRLRMLTCDGQAMGRMTANMLTARRAESTDPPIATDCSSPGPASG